MWMCDTMRYIFNDILEEKFSIKILDLAFHLRSLIDKKLLTENYFVLNVGAGKSFRKWDINNFIQPNIFMCLTFNIVTARETYFF